MKNLFKKVMVGLLVAVMLVTMLPSNHAMAATIKLNKTKVSIGVGKTFQLKLKGTKKKVTWTSSNKKIATVSNKGKVKGIKKGSATIKAKVSGKTYSAKVTVLTNKLYVTLDIRTPDGSAVDTKVIDGKTVYLVPHNSTYTVTKTNGTCLGIVKTIDFKNEQTIGDIHIKGLGNELSDLNEGITYNIDTELNTYPMIYANPHKKYGGYTEDEEWEYDWGYMKNDGQIDINHLPEYSYIKMDIYDQDSGINGIKGTVTYYFKFIDDVSTTSKPSM